LELVWQDWWTNVHNGSADAYSSLTSVSLNYGPLNASPINFPTRGASEWQPRSTDKRFAKAFTAEYYDPTIVMYEYNHAGVKNHVTKVVRDLGFVGGEINELEMIEVLLGGDARGILERRNQNVENSEPPTLREVIEDELEKRCTSNDSE
jgi:hypothetical protein